MMDRERQEKDLQEVFETTQAAYRAAIENTFALQEQTLEFARNLVNTPAETLRTQAENSRAALEALAENSPGGSGKPWRTWLESLSRSTSACFRAPSPMARSILCSRRLQRHLKLAGEGGASCP